MTTEVWKPVVGHESYYEVSNLGRVFSAAVGERNGTTEFTKIDVERIQGLYAVGETYQSIASWLGMHKETAYRARKGIHHTDEYKGGDLDISRSARSGRKKALASYSWRIQPSLQ